MSPAKTTNGHTYAGFADRLGARGTGYQYTFLSISGFSADPGAAWLASATASTVTLKGSSATYSYASGTATWKWTLAAGIFTGTGTINCWIDHK